jgi:hypothetical protein
MHRADLFLRRFLMAAVVSVAVAGPAVAALFGGPPEGGYTELPVQAPPVFNPDKIITIDDKIGSAIVMGVDPATISSDTDGVVRYVSVAKTRNGSTMTAMYEGIRCATAEVKLYARHFTDGDWKPVQEPRWQSLYDSGSPQQSMKIAKAGICQDAAPGGTSRRIVDVLQNDLMRRGP